MYAFIFYLKRERLDVFPFKTYGLLCCFHGIPSSHRSRGDYLYVVVMSCLIYMCVLFVEVVISKHSIWCQPGVGGRSIQFVGLYL